MPSLDAVFGMTFLYVLSVIAVVQGIVSLMDGIAAARYMRRYQAAKRRQSHSHGRQPVGGGFPETTAPEGRKSERNLSPLPGLESDQNSHPRADARGYDSDAAP